MIVIAVVAEIGMMCVYTGGEQSALHRGNGETGGGFWGLWGQGPGCGGGGGWGGVGWGSGTLPPGTMHSVELHA